MFKYHVKLLIAILAGLPETFDNRKIILTLDVHPQVFDDSLGRIANEMLRLKPNLTLMELSCSFGEEDTDEII